MNRLEKQLQFLLEIDALKSVIRRSLLLNGERCENSAEHSWHVAVMAMLLQEHSNTHVDTARVIKMMLIHDVVEVDAGDTYCYDLAADKAEREGTAADRLFGLLPPEQCEEFRALWHEFEAGRTPEARFAAALDRVMPLLHNYHTQGKSWRKHGIVRSQVVAHNQHIRDASEVLWRFVETLIDDCVRKGYLADG